MEIIDFGSPGSLSGTALVNVLGYANSTHLTFTWDSDAGVAIEGVTNGEPVEVPYSGFQATVHFDVAEMENLSLSFGNLRVSTEYYNSVDISYGMSVSVEIPDVPEIPISNGTQDGYSGDLAVVAGPTSGGPTNSASAPLSQFVDGQLKAAVELKVAKMEHSLNEDDRMNPAQDPDTFRIKWTGLNGGAKHFVKVETTKANGDYCDPAREVEIFLWPQNVWATWFLFLVSDEEDNHVTVISRTPSGPEQLIGPTDPRRPSLSFKVELGGKLILKSYRREGSEEINLNRIFNIEIKKLVHIHIMVMADVPDPNSVWSRITTDVANAQERLAQIGVRLVSHLIEPTPPLPAGVANSIVEYFPGTMTVTNSVQSKIEPMITINSATDIHIFYCRGITPDNVLGFAGGGADDSQHKIFMNSAAIPRPFALAHEIVHRLTIRGHYGLSGFPHYHPASEQDPKRRHNLMKPEANADKAVGGGKRLYMEQQKMIKGL